MVYSNEEPKFEFILTRQIQLNLEEEYYQLRLKLLFDSIHFNEIGSMNFWAMDFKTTSEWRAHIEQTNGYIKAKEIEIISYEINLDVTI